MCEVVISASEADDVCSKRYQLRKSAQAAPLATVQLSYAAEVKIT